MKKIREIRNFILRIFCRHEWCHTVYGDGKRMYYCRKCGKMIEEK